MSNDAAQSFTNIQNEDNLVRMGFFEKNQLGVLIQEEDIYDMLLFAFKEGPKSYYYFESGGEVPVAIWTFRFDSLPGSYEVNFDIQRNRPAQVEALFKGEVQPSIRFYLRMAGQFVDVTTLEISPEAWDLFLATLRRQQAVGYQKEAFDKALEDLYAYTSEEIAQMGRKFTVPGKCKTSPLRVIPGGKSRH